MGRPVLLDLFCKAGGAGMGYHRAGFEVVGVDIEPQLRYPFEFVRADVLAPGVVAGLVSRYRPAAVHASPVCKAHTRARVLNRRDHPEQIPQTRELLDATGLPYVVENVEGAPLADPVTLCGTAFGLRVTCRDGVKRELRRHRLFESPLPLAGTPCDHQVPAISVFGDGGPRRNRRPDSRAAYEGPVAERRAVLGIDWMARGELSQAIPPAYTEWIGRQILAHLAVTR